MLVPPTLLVPLENAIIIVGAGARPPTRAARAAGGKREHGEHDDVTHGHASHRPEERGGAPLVGLAGRPGQRVANQARHRPGPASRGALR